MWERSSHNPTAYDDDFEDQPAQSWFHRWIVGVAVPVAIFSFGLPAIVVHETIVHYHAAMSLRGLNAIAFGVATISLAVFLHCHYFWGNVYNQAWFAVLGKIFAACGFIVGLAVLIVRIGVFGAR